MTSRELVFYPKSKRCVIEIVDLLIIMPFQTLMTFFESGT